MSVHHTYVFHTEESHQLFHTCNTSKYFDCCTVHFVWIY